MGLKSVAYGNLVGFLIQVNKEQEKKIMQMEKIMETLSADVKHLHDQNEEIRLIFVVFSMAIVSVLIFVLVSLYSMKSSSEDVPAPRKSTI